MRVSYERHVTHVNESWHTSYRHPHLTSGVIQEFPAMKLLDHRDEKRPIQTQKRPIHTQKRPIHTQKRPIHTQKRPIHTQKRLVY